MGGVTQRPLPGRLRPRLGRCQDLPRLALLVCDAVQREVPFTFGCFATTDPASRLVTWAWKTRSLDVGDEEFAATEFGPPDVNKFADLAGRDEPVGVLSLDTDGDLHRCRRLREFLAPRFGFTDELRVVFRTRGASWGALAIYRGQGDPPFTRQDGQTVAAVHELVADAIARLLFQPSKGLGPRVGGPAVLLVDADDRVLELTTAARERVEELGGWEHGSLPTSVLAVLTAARTSPDMAVAKARGLSGNWLLLRAAPLEGDGGRGGVVVSVEPAPRAELSRLALVAAGLTGREQDVAFLVLQGADTRDIASTLHLSPHTVQDHLKQVFVKLGVSSRREVVARLLA